jgi:hypothetical protein
MKAIKYMIALGLILPFITGCGLSGFTEPKDDAESTMAEVFELIQLRDYESTLNYYSQTFFGAVSEDEWIGLLEHVNEKLGDLESYELLNWNVEKKMGPATGTYVQLVYRTQYSRYEAQEEIVFQKEVRGPDLKIVGHHIKSQGFLKDL